MLKWRADLTPEEIENDKSNSLVINFHGTYALSSKEIGHLIKLTGAAIKNGKSVSFVTPHETLFYLLKKMNFEQIGVKIIR